MRERLRGTGSPEYGDTLAGLSNDERLSSVYDEGQHVEPDTFRLCLNLFRQHAREGTPQSVLDLGCGTGVFDPAHADAFGGPPTLGGA